MTALQLFGPALNDKRSRLRQFVDAIQRASTDLEAAHGNLPSDLASSLDPYVREARLKIASLIEVALIAGYRAGLVDFYEDTPA